LVVYDIDPRHGGDTTWDEMIRTHAVPTTATVATGGGGFHYYFAGSVERVGTDAGGRGVDVKAQGGYVVAPPSVHGSGDRYRWTITGDLARLPGWLKPEPRMSSRSGVVNVQPSTGGGRYALGALRSEAEDARARRDGQRRRDNLFVAGLKLSRFVISGDLREDQIEMVLTAAGVESGLDPDDAAAHVRNGLMTGIRKGAS
jgi:hypothetical protein